MDKPNLEDLEVKIARLQEGDVLVLTTELTLKMEAVKRMTKALEGLLDKVGLKDKVAVAILEQGMKLEVFRKEAA